MLSASAHGERSEPAAWRRLLLALPALLAAVALVQADGPRPGAFAAAVAKAAPSVVRVELPDGRPRPDLPRRHLFREVAARESGAGIVVGPDLVLTHAAVVAHEADGWTIATPGGQRVRAVLARLELQDEVAVLRTLEPLQAPPLATGSAAGLRAGHLVLALGDPFGSGRDATPAASLGVVEGRGRLDAAEVTYRGDVLLTSAAINPGIEGGPLLDLEGRVVGLLAPLARDRRSGALHGHALPIEVALPVVAAARRGAAPVRLGVATRPVGGGLLVERVAAGGPAAAAGLRPNDLLRALDGAPLATNDELRRALLPRAPGERVRLQVRRAGADLELEATLAEAARPGRADDEPRDDERRKEGPR